MGLRCLIVDDSRAFLASACRLLESQGVEVVACASSSREAFELAGVFEPDVVLVDIQLGEEDGLELARQLAKLPRATPVVLISTHSEDELTELLADTSAVGFLPKKALSAAAISRVLG